MRRFFKKSSPVPELALNCVHETFTQQDFQALQITLDLNPTLFLIKHPREESIIHFKHVFDLDANRDCPEQAIIHRNRILTEIVPVIQNGLIRDFQQDEKELEWMLASLNTWTQLMEEGNIWAYCTEMAKPNRSYLEKIRQGEYRDNTFMDYGYIPSAWDPYEIGEAEYEGEYPYESGYRF
jgi:hypothetical protein